MPYYPLSQVKTNLYTNGDEFVLKYDNSDYIGYYWKTSTGKFYTGKTPQDPNYQEIIKQPPKEEQQILKGEVGYNKTVSVLFSYGDPSVNPDYDVSSPTYNEEIIESYLKLNNIPINNPPILNLPTYNSPNPTEKDYQVGLFRRYFCKKSNELIYLEINKDTYDKLFNKDKTYLFQLYVPFDIPWSLTGDRNIVYQTNKNIVELTMQNNNFKMFDSYLRQDFTKYYK
jgi:hypothetical protein